LARGIGFRLSESVGVLKRDSVAEEMRALDQTARAQLRRYGVRFGAFNIFFPTLLKPAAADLLLTLWCLRYGKDHAIDPSAPPEAPRAGLTSAKVDPAIPEAFYRAYGFHVCGPRAVRIDMLERLADHIRPLLSWRAKSEGDSPPKGSTGDGGFTVIPEMMSILGCSPEELGHVLAALGFRLEKREAPKPAPIAAAPAPTEATTSDTEAATPEAGPSEATASEAATPSDPSLSEPSAADQATPDASADAVPVEPVASEVAAEPVTTSTMTPSGDDAPAVSAEVAETDTSKAAEAAAEGEVPEASASAEASPVPDDVPSATDPAATDQATTAQETSESAAPDAVATDQTAVDETATTPAVEAPAEPIMIEIWRPKRRHSGGQRRGRGSRQDGQNAAQGQQAAGGTASGQGDRPERQDRAAKPRGGRNTGRDNRRDGQRPNQDGKGNRGPGRGKPRVDKPGGGRRDEQRRGLNVHTSAPARSKGADPDSPFAALSALKDSLSKNDGKT